MLRHPISSPVQAASQGLRLRAWALPLLAGASTAGPPAASPAEWGAFLAAERCALPLRQRLGGAGHLPGEAAAVLDARATVEMKRFLSAAAQCRRVAGELRRWGWTGVALKGGAAAASGGEPLDVVDLDLLVEPGNAAALARVLDERCGFRATRADPGPGLTGGWELAPRGTERDIPVEIHYDVPHLGAGVDPWAGLRPTRVEGVFRLAPATHLLHLLVHSVVHHVERRGQIRELVLLRAALEACTAGERAGVRARVQAHPLAEPLLAVWEMAEALAAGRVPDDPFAGVAAVRLAMAAGVEDAYPRGPALRTFKDAAYAMAAGEGEFARLWYGARSSVLPPADFRGDSWLDRR
ncbi:MAG TPA: nucleotidyltransferase family protein, partial [Longimicrobium sp.]|uniref:nucleotidyltransferase family protein n=1 Tax=Longimicrobium sp. TaxID=2029185 RepID=UPI002ED7C93C